MVKPGREGTRGTNFAALISSILEGRTASGAWQDALTGMPNRVLFTAVLDDACASPERDGLALLRVCADDMPSLRADHGQATADTLVAAIGGRLRRSIRAGDVAGRLRDGDFGLILAADDVAEAACAAQRVLDRLREPFEVSGALLDVTVSIGIAYAPPGPVDGHVLMERAEIALERARAIGTGAFKIFRPTQGVDPETQRSLLADLREALARGAMSLGFRPVVDSGTLHLRGADVVLQWDHPKIGLISSSDFLPVLADPEASRLLTEWTVARICEVAARHGLSLPLVLPLDASTPLDGAFVARIADALAGSGRGAETIAFGIAEPMFRGLDAEALATFAALRRLGVRIVLDDHVGNVLSHETIRALPVDGIRTSAAMLDELQSDIGAFVRLQGLTGLASSLRLPIGAKGVENQEELETVRRLGFAEVQGALFGPPLTVGELAATLARGIPLELRG